MLWGILQECGALVTPEGWRQGKGGGRGEARCVKVEGGLPPRPAPPRPGAIAQVPRTLSDNNVTLCVDSWSSSVGCAPPPPPAACFGRGRGAGAALPVSLLGVFENKTLLLSVSRTAWRLLPARAAHNNSEITRREICTWEPGWGAAWWVGGPGAAAGRGGSPVHLWHMGGPCRPRSLMRGIRDDGSLLLLFLVFLFFLVFHFFPHPLLLIGRACRCGREGSHCLQTRGRRGWWLGRADSQPGEAAGGRGGSGGQSSGKPIKLDAGVRGGAGGGEEVHVAAATGVHTLTLVRRQVELLLEVLELAHEVEVGRDVGLLDAHVLVGFLEVELLLVHEVGDGDGDGAGDAGQAVHQHAHA
ncbi:hypothetical protein E2C01_029835 [Portunus trituberculatus]|uniref:Uncharacterized protein n=1 Tax=Portunus trituberculatus TaxID=210409 RepID=A0A5B7ETH4_PORTR|nr:hypothetical protein [Portunus trituberculatus]